MADKEENIKVCSSVFLAYFFILNDDFLYKKRDVCILLLDFLADKYSNEYTPFWAHKTQRLVFF